MESSLLWLAEETNLSRPLAHKESTSSIDFLKENGTLSFTIAIFERSRRNVPLKFGKGHQSVLLLCSARGSNCNEWGLPK